MAISVMAVSINEPRQEIYRLLEVDWRQGSRMQCGTLFVCVFFWVYTEYSLCFNTSIILDLLCFSSNSSYRARKVASALPPLTALDNAAAFSSGDVRRVLCFDLASLACMCDLSSLWTSTWNLRVCSYSL